MSSSFLTGGNHHLSELTKGTLRQGQAGCKKEVKTSSAITGLSIEEQSLPELYRLFTQLLSRWWSNQHAIQSYARFRQKDAPTRRSVMLSIPNRLACRMRKLLRIE